MTETLKNKAGSSLFWNFLDKGGQQLIQFGFLLILVRKLLPEDFGVIGLLAIFPIVANILQESGFSSALIRKKDADQTDYSSVFFFNIGLGIILYIILFLCAPLISIFYKDPDLTNLSRVIFLTFVFNGFGLIQYVHLSKRMDFKINTKITFFAGITSGMIAVYAASSGYGVWSLVIQQVLQSFIRNAGLWIFIGWKPSVSVSFVRLKLMMPYSFKLLATSVMNQVSGYIYPLTIGKSFSLTDVGYYSQANKLNSIPQAVIGDSIRGVAFPLLTKVDGKERIKRVFRKTIRVAAFICFPIAGLTIIGAKPLVVLILTEQYLPSIPILQILAVCGAVYPLYTLTASLLQRLGDSGKIFRIEAVRNILMIVSVFFTVRFGILGMVTGMAAVYFISFFVAFIVSGKSIGYNIAEVLKDIAPYFSLSGLIFMPLYFLNLYIENDILLFAAQLIIGGGIYLAIIKLLGSKVMEDCLEFIKKKER